MTGNRPDIRLAIVPQWQAFKDAKKGRGLRTAHVNHPQLRGSIGYLHLLADEIMIEMVQYLLRLARFEIHQENIVLIMADEKMGDYFGLGGAQECLTTHADRKILHIIRAQIVQEQQGFLAGQLDLSPIGKIEQGGMSPSGSVFFPRIAIMTRNSHGGIVLPAVDGEWSVVKIPFIVSHTQDHFCYDTPKRARNDKRNSCFWFTTWVGISSKGGGRGSGSPLTTPPLAKYIHRMTKTHDVAIIGGGIVGLATAMTLLQRYRISLVVLETEETIAAHQTGHNSGVIHSGLYYKPGSLKARNCLTGRAALLRFCQEHDIPHEQCGKVVVATQESELPALENLAERGTANGLLGLKKLRAEEIKEYESHVTGIAGLWVPETGIVDFKQVAQRYADIVTAEGGSIQTGARVRGLRRLGNNFALQTSRGEFPCRNLINCGGLQSDRVCRLCGVEPGLQILPFRGEYYQLVPERCSLVRNLIYPVPDPRFPFLGVHFTRMIHGGVEAGPNAVLAFRREGYHRLSFSFADFLQMLGYRGFWRMAWKYGGTGLGELVRSFSKRAFVRALQRLIPELQAEDIRPAGAGVRAQAVDPSGALVDDFRFVQGERMIHVLNAPSPAATASISIGQTIADLAAKNFDLGQTSNVKCSISNV